jgi:non-ribosomal peptide synthetase component F
MLASCYILFSKISGQEDIIIGIPTNGRRYADLDKIVGMFVNTIALRCFPEQAKILSVFLDEVKHNLIGALENQDYQFDELVQRLNLSRTDCKNPLFEVMFQMQESTRTRFSLPEIELNVIDINLTSEFKMTFSITEYNEKLVVKLIYRKDLFSREVVQQLLAHFDGILADICIHTDIPLENVGMNALGQSKAGNQTFDIQFNLDWSS